MIVMFLGQKSCSKIFLGTFRSKISKFDHRTLLCLFTTFCNFSPGGKDDGVINTGINMMDKEQDV